MVKLIFVSVKWGSKLFSDVQVDLDESPAVFKAQLLTLTGVALERQKIMGLKGLRGGDLPDDFSWEKTGIRDKGKLMLIGTAEELVAPSKPIVFIEDMTEEERANLNVKEMPSGLVNLGNTCYANSALQVLFRVPKLKEALAEFADSKREATSLVDLSPAVVRELSRLVRNVDASAKAVDPILFVSLLRRVAPQFDETDERTGGHRQQDADEFWTSMLAMIDSSLGSGIVDSLFGVKMRHTYKNIEFPDEVQVKEEMNRKLVCHISKDISHVQYGISEGLQEHLSKFSQQLQRNAEWERTSRISVLPPFLTVNFLRFLWKVDRTGKQEDGGVRAKILRVVKFPLVFDTYEFCVPELQESIQKRRVQLAELETPGDKKKGTETGTGPAGISIEIPGGAKTVAEPRPRTPPEELSMEIDKKEAVDHQGEVATTRGLYDLIGIVSHQGRSAAGGHYNAWVRNDVGKPWYRFDDDAVTEVTEADILKLVGSADWHTAYINLYKLRME